jgi:hypothetical protein
MKTKSISAALLGAVSLPLLLAIQPAAAKFSGGVQTTHYTGGSCQPTNGSNAAHAQVDSRGRIFNTSSTDVLAVDCQVTIDPFEGKTHNVLVGAIDQKAHPGSSLTCKFQMVNPLTGAIVSQSLFITSDAKSSPTQVEVIRSSILTGTSHGVLNCFIPAADATGKIQSGISGYDVVDTE